MRVESLPSPLSSLSWSTFIFGVGFRKDIGNLVLARNAYALAGGGSAEVEVSLTARLRPIAIAMEVMMEKDEEGLFSR